MASKNVIINFKTSGVSGVNSATAKIESGMGGLVAGAAAFTLAMRTASKALETINLAGRFEQWDIAFDVMIGKTKLAQQTVSELQQFAARTPFEIPGIMDASQHLMAAGVEAEDLIGTFKMLGDVASGVGVDKLPTIVSAFAKIKAKGIPTMRQLNQFTRAGVPIIRQLALSLYGSADATDEVYYATKRGNISFAQTVDAFRGMSREGGLFYQMMERQHNSYIGLVSDMHDKITLLRVSLGKMVLPLLKQFITELSESIALLADNIEAMRVAAAKLPTPVKDIGSGVATTTAVVGRNAIAVVGVAAAWGNLLKILKLVPLAGLKGLGAAGLALTVAELTWRTSDKMIDSWDKYNKKIQDNWKEVYKAKGAWSELDYSINTNRRALNEYIESVEEANLDPIMLWSENALEGELAYLNEVRDAWKTLEWELEQPTDAAAITAYADALLEYTSTAYEKELAAADAKMTALYNSELSSYEDRKAIYKKYCEELEAIRVTYGKDIDPLPTPKTTEPALDMFEFEGDDFVPDIDVDLFRSDSEMMLLINNHTNQMIADGIDMLDEKKIKAHEDALARAEKEKEIIGDVVRDSLALFNDISTERVSALDREQQAMQETAEYQNATVEDKAAMDKEYNSKKKGILSTQFEVTRLARFAEMGMNTAEAIMEAAPNVPLQIAVGALGAAQGAFIMSQANPYRAALGADFETNGQMLMLVGDNPGGREHVTVTPTSSPNVRGGHGGDLALIEEVRALRVELSTIQRYNIRTIDAVEMSMINEEGGLQRGVI